MYSFANFIVLRVFQFIYLSILVSRIKNKTTLVIFDIDNTIADTYPYILADGTIDYNKLPTFPHVVKLVNEKLQNPNYFVCFFSVRPFHKWSVTYKWLKKNRIIKYYDQLVFCSTPMEKLLLVKKILRKRSIEILLFDDLSYNHENGDIKFYDDVINEIKLLDISYVDYFGLKKIQ